MCVVNCTLIVKNQPVMALLVVTAFCGSVVIGFKRPVNLEKIK